MSGLSSAGRESYGWSAALYPRRAYSTPAPAPQGEAAPERRDLLKKMERLECTNLVAKFADGETETGPLVALRQRTTKGKRLLSANLEIHPAIMRGIYGPGGLSYWPTSLQILKVPALPGRGDVFPIAVIVGQQFHIEAKRRNVARPVAKKNGRDLLESIGGRWRQDRTADSRAGKRLTEALEAAQACNIIDSFELSGDPSAPDTIWRMPAPQDAVDMVHGRTPLLRPSTVPNTGTALGIWLDHLPKNIKKKDIAAHLKVSTRALRDAVKRGQRPLPGSLRVRLADYLWRSE